jgi:hypothetical protein
MEGAVFLAGIFFAATFLGAAFFSAAFLAGAAFTAVFLAATFLVAFFAGIVLRGSSSLSISDAELHIVIFFQHCQHLSMV